MPSTAAHCTSRTSRASRPNLSEAREALQRSARTPTVTISHILISSFLSRSVISVEEVALLSMTALSTVAPPLVKCPRLRHEATEHAHLLPRRGQGKRGEARRSRWEHDGSGRVWQRKHDLTLFALLTLTASSTARHLRASLPRLLARFCSLRSLASSLSRLSFVARRALHFSCRHVDATGKVRHASTAG
jgi:hypothetical protein